ncbi:ComF family protein [Desulfosarcina cetonica]
MRREIRRWLTGLADALFPLICRDCGRFFAHADGAGHSPLTQGETIVPGFQTAMAGHFCPACRQRWTPVTSPLCSRCGQVFKSRAGDDHLCGRCLEEPGAFNRARALGVYEGSLRTAIQALKFKGVATLADPLGRLLLAGFRQYWPTGDIDIVAPVPLHRRRFRQRGFNQAYLLIRGWDLPAGSVVLRDLLVRRRATAPQTGLDRRQRRMNLKAAFAPRRPGQATGKRVLLVDDVLTTGATADACARALLQDGAARVDLLTLARAM